ncbi:MAG TPA: MBL fold metallo-hydrolase [Burkholderiales bacterium]|nr:MBL fold metallo-hydrolase [Burkholderiales bacterium]
MNKPAWIFTAATLLTALAGSALPQTASPKAAASGTVLITLGTRGGPLPTRGRTQSANLLVVNEALYLIDAGDGVTRRIVKSGYDFRQVGRVFITHAHSDHTMGLATLLVSQWEYQRREPTVVYGSGAEALVKGAIAYLTPNAEIRWAEGKRTRMAEVFRGQEVAPGAVYQDANVRVTAVENSHFNFAPDTPGYGKYRSYSYRFETPGRVVVFSGDTGPSEALTNLARDADVLVSEVTVFDDVIELLKRNGAWQAKTVAEQVSWIRHMREEHVTPEQVGRMAAAAGVKSVVLSHFSPGVDRRDDYQRYAVEARKFFSGHVVVAKDLMQF